MMDVPLTIDWIADRAERWMADGEVVSRRPDRSLSRTTYGALIGRAKRLARALIGTGIHKGDRVATLMWNHAEHLETYFGIPLSGAVIHTLNLRLHPDEIAFIAKDAGDRMLIVDDVLVPLLVKVLAAGATFEKIWVVGTHGTYESYEALLASAPGADVVALPKLAETDALGLCYTSGTTGRLKGVVYSHRSTVLHSLVVALPDSLNVCRNGVPTIWIGIRDALEANPTKYKLLPTIRMIVGGSAAPEQLIRDFDKFGLRLIHAWGMTETSPVGTVSRLSPELEQADLDTQYKQRAKQAARCRSSIYACATKPATCLPTTRPVARSRSAAPSSPAGIGVATRPSVGPRTVTSRPAMSRGSTSTAISSSRIASPT